MSRTKLSPKQIADCEKELKLAHPLHSTSVFKIFAPLRPIYRTCIKRRRTIETAELRKSEEMESSQIDPDRTGAGKFRKTFASFGYGFNYYFELLFRLILFFLFVSGISLYTISVLGNFGEGFKEEQNSLFSYTIGNLGTISGCVFLMCKVKTTKKQKDMKSQNAQ